MEDVTADLKDKKPTDEEIIQKIKRQLTNHEMVFISSQYPMNADGYLLREQIGEGMMANKVFLAECLERNNERVAIKQIDLSHQSTETKEKITKEVQGMSVVTSSEFVVRFHCSFVFEETLWIVMDLQEGSVRDVLKWKYPHGMDDESVIGTILYQTLQGIYYLHEQRMIHRDIKAGNILFNQDGHIKLADFGVSTILASHDEKRSTMAGTWHWMAPEVIDPSDHGGYDFRADIWSLGITCIELSYGMAPYCDSKPNQVIVYIMQNPPPNLDVPRVPQSTNAPLKKFSNIFKEFVCKCLQSDPKKRPIASKLLSHKFFKELQKPTTLKQALLEGLPSLGDRFRKQQEMRKENIKACLGKNGTNIKLGRNTVSTKEKKSNNPRSNNSKRKQKSEHLSTSKGRNGHEKSSSTNTSKENISKDHRKSKDDIPKKSDLSPRVREKRTTTTTSDHIEKGTRETSPHGEKRESPRSGDKKDPRDNSPPPTKECSREHSPHREKWDSPHKKKKKSDSSRRNRNKKYISSSPVTTSSDSSNSSSS